jgi:hypothetical protein
MMKIFHSIKHALNNDYEKSEPLSKMPEQIFGHYCVMGAKDSFFICTRTPYGIHFWHNHGDEYNCGTPMKLSSTEVYQHYRCFLEGTVLTFYRDK